METQKRCESCGRLMFGYRVSHNGKDTVMWRCSTPHYGFSNFKGKASKKA